MFDLLIINTRSFLHLNEYIFLLDFLNTNFDSLSLIMSIFIISCQNNTYKNICIFKILSTFSRKFYLK
jgi:hypothetical protein